MPLLSKQLIQENLWSSKCTERSEHFVMWSKSFKNSFLNLLLRECGGHYKARHSYLTLWVLAQWPLTASSNAWSLLGTCHLCSALYLAQLWPFACLFAESQLHFQSFRHSFKVLGALLHCLQIVADCLTLSLFFTHSCATTRRVGRFGWPQLCLKSRKTLSSCRNPSSFGPVSTLRSSLISLTFSSFFATVLRALSRLS